MAADTGPVPNARNSMSVQPGPKETPKSFPLHTLQFV
jgi:hypothetical protein